MKEGKGQARPAWRGRSRAGKAGDFKGTRDAQRIQRGAQKTEAWLAFVRRACR
jgi:hypothetical protein